MVEIYDAHEQGEVVKNWLKENGSAIVMGLVIAFGGLFGFKQWQGWQEGNRQQASSEYAVMVELLAQDQLDAAMSNYQTLQDEHSGSPYSSMAALQMARARLDAKQSDLAIGLLESVMESGYPKALTVIARLRLARVLLDQGRAADAMAALDGATDRSGFEAQFAEVRGDIHSEQGQTEQAILAYQQALEELEAGVGDRARLTVKLQSMGAEVPEETSES
jgi:predicted negative regulator of RcsB-dependent stress response